MQENIPEKIFSGQFTNPHGYLGVQQNDMDRSCIRLWRPGQKSCPLIIEGSGVLAELVHASGLFEYALDQPISACQYQVFFPNGQVANDPYAFPHASGELDTYFAAKGVHYEVYNFLGSTPGIYEKVPGIKFAVWAPNARSVSLIGDFNQWNPLANPMRLLDGPGIWELFIPSLGEGERYLYHLISDKGEAITKSDPVSHAFSLRPNTTSKTAFLHRFSWNDDKWLESRPSRQRGEAAISIYEVHLGSWKRQNGEFLNYRELALSLSAYCKEHNFTHIELVGLCEHPLDESWGYQVTGYFAPTSRHGSPEEFQYFVNHLHNQEIGVIVDWVPAHFPNDPHALVEFDGTCLYEHRDPRQGFHPQWETHIFNYGRWEVSNFLIGSALFWLEKMHVDGLRVDAVSSMLYLDYCRNDGEWVPNKEGANINLEAIEFFKHLNSIVHQRVPGVMMIAEESHAFPGVTHSLEEQGLGFDYKWNMGWMNDILTFFSHDFNKRSDHFSKLTFPFSFAFEESYILVLSHDEVVHEKKSLYGKMPGTHEEKLAGVRLLLSLMCSMPGKKLLFMGGEFGQDTEWNCNQELPWHLLDELPRAQLAQMVRKCNEIYHDHPALHATDTHKQSFSWASEPDADRCFISYYRQNETERLLCIHNFSNQPIEKIHLAVQGLKCTNLLLNTDSAQWGGSDTLPMQIDVDQEGVTLNIPPLTTLILSVE